MALIRIITNVDAREVIIFVNRIDELEDPARQVSEIRESICNTLRTNQGPENVEIIFGSAHWATRALDGSAASCDADTLWATSGIQKLLGAIARRICAGSGAQLADLAARDVRNLKNGMKASVAANPRISDAGRHDANPAAVMEAIRCLAADREMALNRDLELLQQDLETRISRSHQSFLQRATAALIEHLEQWGGNSAWKYDPTGLRMLLRSAYQLYAKRANDTATAAFETTAKEITQLYWHHKLVEDSTFAIEPPVPPQAPAPVLLGQTIALDLQTNWWSRWWRRRRGYAAFAKEFQELIHAETVPILNDLIADHAVSVRSETLGVLRSFTEDQSRILQAALGNIPAHDPPRGRTAAGRDVKAGQARLRGIVGVLDPPRAKGTQ